MEKYATLKNQYPDFLSLDELSRVCKISKRSARYLVEHGIIAAIDTGKQTWRYQIKIDDVIKYLILREKLGSMIPPGAVTSRAKKRISPKFGSRKSFSQYITSGYENTVMEYFKHIYADYNDVLTTAEVIEMTGLNKSTVLKLLKKGQIKSLANRPTYRIPKEYLLEFVVTRRFIEAKTDSELFKKILGGFEIWIATKSSR
ncbi:MAG: helix-turn-helix domain-containing protein [Oscillospiraceae bacterium]|nr:helix-turn-helix domain-containing protein [Oscillospiraceae bacterium]